MRITDSIKIAAGVTSVGALGPPRQRVDARAQTRESPDGLTSLAWNNRGKNL